MYDVTIAPCEHYTELGCRAALEGVLAPLGGLDWVRPGMRVGIKVNLVAAMKPETAATVHPVLLCELVKLLIAQGAQVVVGDSPGGLFTQAFVEHVYHVCGLEAVEACGGSLNRDFSTVEIDRPEAVVAKTFTTTAWLRDCDEIINFCKLKSHGMMGLSCAAKNLFGTIPGTQKPEYHFRFPDYAQFADMLVDLDDFWAPRLSICDAVRAMEGNGPTAGTPRPMGLVLAAENPHRLDLLAAALVGLKEQDVPTLEAARRRGVCVCNIPAYSTDSVAQMTFALLLEICMHPARHSDSVHAGDWAACPDFCFWETPLIELAGKTLGIVGFGQIGRAVARVAVAMGMAVSVVEILM